MAPSGDTLGHLVLLCVGVEDEDNQDEDGDNIEKTVNIYVWTPNEVLEVDKGRMIAGCSYHDCIDDMSWDDWTGPFKDFFEPSWCETGCYEAENIWEDVRLDDPRIQVAYVDPLNCDYSMRCLSMAQLAALRK